VEIEGVDLAMGRDGACQRSGERSAARTRLENDATGHKLEVGDDEADVGDVKDLGAVAEHQSPELRGGRQEVHEPATARLGLASSSGAALITTSAATEYLGSEGAADPVVVAEDAEPVLEHAAGAHRDGAHRVVALVHHDRVALRDATLRGGLGRGVQGDHRHGCGRITASGGRAGRRVGKSRGRPHKARRRGDLGIVGWI